MDRDSEGHWSLPVLVGVGYAAGTILAALARSILPLPIPWIEGILGAAVGIVFGPVGVVGVALGEVFRLLFRGSVVAGSLTDAASVVILAGTSAVLWRHWLESGRSVRAGLVVFLAVLAVTGSVTGWIGTVLGAGPFFPIGFDTAIEGAIAQGLALVGVLGLRRYAGVTVLGRTPEYTGRVSSLLIVGGTWLVLGTGISVIGQDLPLVPTSSLQLYVPSLVRSALVVLRTNHVWLQIGLGLASMALLAWVHRDDLRSWSDSLPQVRA